MNNTIRWLRISYWVAAIGDFYLAFQWAFQGDLRPDRFPDAGYNAGIKYIAVLALSWGILLLWADRKPQERQDILVITIFPVISGLIVCNLLAYDAGFEGRIALIRSFGMGALIALMAFSYLNAKRAETSALSLSGKEGALGVVKVLGRVKQLRAANPYNVALYELGLLFDLPTIDKHAVAAAHVRGQVCFCLLIVADLEVFT